MKIAILTTDSREHFSNYERREPYFGTAPEALLQGLALISNIEIHVISCLQKKVESVEKIAENIYYHGLYVPKLGWLRTGYQGCIRATRRKLREINPDVVHGQGTERDCAMEAVFSGYPNVLTIHGNMQVMAAMCQARPFSFYWLAAKLEQLCLARTNGVVCITDYTLRTISGQTGKTWTIPNAVDGSFFEIVSRSTSPQQILYVGNICQRKNQNAFIRAMDLLPELHQRQLIFLGSKPNDSYGVEFDTLVAERTWCRFGGMANREKLKVYFSQASLLVLVSLEDNCPMVVLEAMAAGVPVVAGAVGGVPELIEDGVNGWLCDPTNEDSIRATMEKVLGTESHAQKMAFQARKDAVVRYHPLVIALRHVEIYRELCNTKGCTA